MNTQSYLHKTFQRRGYKLRMSHYFGLPFIFHTRRRLVRHIHRSMPISSLFLCSLCLSSSHILPSFVRPNENIYSGEHIQRTGGWGKATKRGAPFDLNP